MSNTRIVKHARLAWLGLVLGLAGGLVLAVFLPNTPLQAVATDRSDTFAMATVSLDESIEAVCFLDFLTGNLGAATVSKMNGQFVAFWGCNVNKDLGVDPAKSPRYMIVSGNADLRRVGGAQSGPSRGIIYVAEITSGKVGAYCIPWSPAVRNQATPARGQIKCLERHPLPHGGGPRRRGVMPPLARVPRPCFAWCPACPAVFTRFFTAGQASNGSPRSHANHRQ